jgi:DNA primase
MIEDKPLLLEVVLEHYGIEMPTSRRKMCCPVHDETRPSAVVDPYTGSWKCFACQEHGDGYDIIKHKENVSFQDAIEIAQGIFNRSGRDIPAGDGGKSRTGVSRKAGNRSASRKYVPSWVR